MLFLRENRPEIKLSYSLVEASKQLKITPTALLEYASKKKLRAYVKLPDNVFVCSVHSDAVDIDDSVITATKNIRQFWPLDELEAKPVNMDGFNIEGLLLNTLDCIKILRNPNYRKRLFDYGIKFNFGVELIKPVPGNFSVKEKFLKPEGWKIAFYPRNKDITFNSGIGYSRPQGIDFKLDEIYIIGDDLLQALVDSFDINIYVSELFVGSHLIGNRPAYFSEKLNYIIDCSRKRWADIEQSEEHLFYEQREAVENDLREKGFERTKTNGASRRALLVTRKPW